MDGFWLRAWTGLCALWLVAWALWLPPVGYWPLWLLFGYALADAGSYLFHYIIDHYGDPRRTGLVRDFQFHHLEPWGIANRSLGAVILPAARIVTPVLALWLGAGLLGLIPPTLLLLGWELGVLWVFTQVFHRWAHMPTRGLVRLAQRWRLVVGRQAHARHHTAPFHSHFAVINGWSNGPLDRLRAPAAVDWLLGGLGFRKRGLEHSLKLLVDQPVANDGTFSTKGRSHIADA